MTVHQGTLKASYIKTMHPVKNYTMIAQLYIKVITEITLPLLQLKFTITNTKRKGSTPVY